MLSGFEGVRYGLTVPKKASKPGIQKNLSAFGDDDDSGDEKKAVGKNIERQAQRKLSDQKVEDKLALQLEKLWKGVQCASLPNMYRAADRISLVKLGLDAPHNMWPDQALIQLFLAVLG